MIGTIALLLSILGSIKNFLKGSIEENYNREYEKIDDIAYVGNKGLTDRRTGHSLSVVNKYTYYDFKSRKYIKKGTIDPADIKEDEINKQRAIKINSNIYPCSTFYLPGGVRGRVYKSVDKDRLYTRRKIHSNYFLSNEDGYIFDEYYISLSPENYGHVELGSRGKELTEKEKKLTKYVLDLTTVRTKNDEYEWWVDV